MCFLPTVIHLIAEFVKCPRDGGLTKRAEVTISSFEAGQGRRQTVARQSSTVHVRPGCPGEISVGEVHRLKNA